MAEKKYYAVKCGKKVGIFNSWSECKEQVHGFKGAIYKSFTSLIDAENYLSGESVAVNIEDEDCVVAYVDGSYDNLTGEFSCGGVIIYKGIEEEFYEKFVDKDLATMRNVAGEIMGARFAMQYCLDNGYDKLVIYHDYQGISAWCDGSWKANKEGTVDYRNFYLKAKDKVQIKFVKVKGHSGDKYNDIADKMAKKALGK